MENSKMRVILASGSPRRRELMKYIVPDFEVIPSNAEEELEEGLIPQKQVERLAYIKAKSVFDETKGDRIVIGSDTMVVKNGKIYGKPKDEEDAKRMIRELDSGDRTNIVITGLAVLVEKDGKISEYKTYDETKVTFTEISDEEIDTWIKSGKALDKAGAYAVQEDFTIFIEKIDGSHTTVIGFPMHKVYEAVKNYLN